MTRSISRVLLKTAIYLGKVLPSLLNATSIGLPSKHICPSTVLLQIGFTQPICLHIAGELLPHLSILTIYGGNFLLHYPWGRPRRPLAVIFALWSSDFPRIVAFAPNRSCPIWFLFILYYIKIFVNLNY